MERKPSVGKKGTVAKKSPGRPPIDDEPVVKASVSMLARHHREMSKHPEGLSAAIREAIDLWLKRRRK